MPSADTSYQRGLDPLDTAIAEHDALAIAAWSPKWCAELAAHVAPEDFTDPWRRTVFEAIKAVRATSSPAPGEFMVALREHLQPKIATAPKEVAMPKEGLGAFLLDLIDLGAIVAHSGVEYGHPAIERIVEVAKRRKILAKAQQTVNAIRNGKTSTDLLTDLQQFIFDTTRNEQTAQTIDIKHTIEEITDELDKGVPFGIPSGFPRLDELTHGWQPGRRYILGARPSVGKSTLLGWFAWEALLQGHNVLLFSVEVDAHTFARFFLSQIAHIAADKMVHPDWLHEPDWADITKAIGDFANPDSGKLLVNDDGGLTLEKFTAATHAAHAEHGIDLILLDYIQRMDRPKDNSTAREVGKLSAGISTVAQRLHIPTVCAAQLNRKLEHRSNKKPVLADLRESGDLEQDADVVMFLWRDAPETDEQAQGREAITAHLGVAKNRFGALGRVDLIHRPWLREFSEV